LNETVNLQINELYFLNELMRGREPYVLKQSASVEWVW